MKKKIKIGFIIAIALLTLIAFNIWEQEELERCVNAGNSKELCEVKMGG